jgi:hypothetical protein
MTDYVFDFTGIHKFTRCSVYAFSQTTELVFYFEDLHFLIAAVKNRFYRSLDWCPVTIVNEDLSDAISKKTSTYEVIALYNRGFTYPISIVKPEITLELPEEEVFKRMSSYVGSFDNVEVFRDRFLIDKDFESFVLNKIQLIQDLKQFGNQVFRFIKSPKFIFVFPIDDDPDQVLKRSYIWKGGDDFELIDESIVSKHSRF